MSISLAEIVKAPCCLTFFLLPRGATDGVLADLQTKSIPRQPMVHSHRNVFLLAACQALAMTSMTIMITVASLTGRMLAEDDSFATLPLAFQYLATWLTTIPASTLMRRIGRRAGFSIGASLGVTGAGLIALAVIDLSFWLMCLGNMLVGVCMGFCLFF